MLDLSLTSSPKILRMGRWFSTPKAFEWIPKAVILKWDDANIQGLLPYP
jgi:hypothetical protein